MDIKNLSQDLLNPVQSKSIGQWCLSPVWKISLNLDSKFNHNLLKEIITFYMGISDASIKSTDLIFHESTLFNELKKIILEQIRMSFIDFAEQNASLPPEEFPFEIRSAWLNMLPPGESISMHVHPNSALNATYYLNTPSNSGDIVIINTQEIAENPNSGTARPLTIRPKESNLIFFPGYVLHKVEPNNSNEVRISLTFDLQFKDRGTKNTSNRTAQSIMSIFNKYYPASPSGAK